MDDAYRETIASIVASGFSLLVLTTAFLALRSWAERSMAEIWARCDARNAEIERWMAEQHSEFMAALERASESVEQVREFTPAPADDTEASQPDMSQQTADLIELVKNHEVDGVLFFKPGVVVDLDKSWEFVPAPAKNVETGGEPQVREFDARCLWGSPEEAKETLSSMMVNMAREQEKEDCKVKDQKLEASGGAVYVNGYPAGVANTIPAPTHCWSWSASYGREQPQAEQPTPVPIERRIAKLKEAALEQEQRRQAVLVRKEYLKGLVGRTLDGVLADLKLLEDVMVCGMPVLGQVCYQDGEDKGCLKLRATVFDEQGQHGIRDVVHVKVAVQGDAVVVEVDGKVVESFQVLELAVEALEKVVAGEGERG